MRTGAIYMRAAVLLLTVVACLMAVQPVFAASQAPVQTYFVPLPEDMLFESFDTINPSKVYGSVHTLIAVAVAADNTVIYYDHWEDGYEQDVTSPAQSTTEVWGDGDPSNGSPPGFPGDILSAGDAIILENLVSLPRNPSTVLYDARDRIQASFPVAVTRGAWPEHPGSLLAGATEVWDTVHLGTYYVVPVGEDTSLSGDTDPFEYAAIYVQAEQDNTQVSLNGSLVATLNAGETYSVRVNQGDSVTSTAPVQVDLVTGDIGSEYEMRWYSMIPRDDWSNNYYTPVGTGTHQTKVWLYNPGSSSLDVSYDFHGGSSPDGTISVPAHGVALSPHVPDNSGARFYAAGDFFALTQTDTDSSTGGATSDWGHPLIPVAKLSSQVLVGWGYGNTSNSPSVASRSVVWVTPVSDATIHIDFDGDGTVDDTRSVSALSSLKILDDSSIFSGAQDDQNMTGAIIYATDSSGNPVDIAVAWGQDPARSFSGDNEALDLGTVVPPLPLVGAGKSAVRLIDADGNGRFSPSDTLKYVIRVVNIGRVGVPSGSITISDDVPANTTYVANSTRYYDGATTSSIADAGATAFPLDEGGISNPAALPPGAAHEVSFEVTIAAFVCPSTIVNQALVSANEDITARVETPLFCEDFGDAPNSYGTTQSANGASNILGSVRLGAAVDGEATGQPATAADGDDTADADGDDEDGVLIPAKLTAGQTSIVPVSVTGGEGVLSAWIDWNRNGTFETSERVFNDQVLTATDHFLNVSVPADASSGSTYARFRLTAGTTGSANSNSPTGAAGIGEVEDYHVEIQEAFDFGDAPDTYGTTVSASGARNTLGSVRLGAAVDGEATGQPTAGADGDDTNPSGGTDDEDGVALPATLTAGQTSLATVSVAGGAGVLSAWLDWNRNGAFETGERVFDDLALTAAVHFLNVPVPADASPGSTYARFRLTAGTAGSTNSNSPTGAAGVGEVEDYQVSVEVLDFGDAPATYGDAKHVIASGPCLGSVGPDAEAQTAYSAGADGDDTAGAAPDDEDGVQRAGGKAGTGGWTNGTVASNNGGAIQVQISSGLACLGVFMDFDNNGDFTGAGETVELRDASGNAITQPIAVGTTTYYFDVPAGTFAGTAHPIYARFRVTSPVGGGCTGSAAFSATGQASDGEVEDYKWNFGPNAVQMTRFVARPAGLAEALAQLWRPLTGR